jgi:hypothetical protein
MLEAVRAFNPYDLYSKSDEVPSVEELKVCCASLFIAPRNATNTLLALLHGAH